LVLALVASLGLLLAAGAAAIVLANDAAEAERWVTHTLEVRRNRLLCDPNYPSRRCGTRAVIQ